MSNSIWFSYIDYSIGYSNLQHFCYIAEVFFYIFRRFLTNDKSFNVAKDKKIPNGYNYVATIIENNMKQNVTNITVNKTSKNSFNNYAQREISEEEYNDIERRLLGWDD